MISFSGIILYWEKYEDRSEWFIKPEEILSISLKIVYGSKPLILYRDIL